MPITRGILALLSEARVMELAFGSVGFESKKKKNGTKTII